MLKQPNGRYCYDGRMKHHIIYVPGIGDHRSYGQKIAINLWRFFGFTPHYFPLTWNREDGLETKIQRLVEKIDSLRAEGDFVSLVGISAGASAVLNAYAQRMDIMGVVYICGKINHTETIWEEVLRINPDFARSLKQLPRSLQVLGPKHKKRLLNLHPRKDLAVPPEDTFIAGATEVIVPGWSHMTGIFFGVIYGAPIISKFLKQLRNNQF